MEARITALIGLALMAAFCLFVAYKVGALPLTLITLLVVALAAIDVWQGAIRGDNERR